jgi:L-amino acid N-acyltransferase YncA
MKIENCTIEDFQQIYKDITDFWGSDRTLHLHHPFLIYEMGDTAFVIKEDHKVIAYLFGFFSQKEKTAYTHLIGVREKYQRNGLGYILYGHFIEIAKNKGYKKIKAITTPANEKSINFHKKIGMELLGEPNKDGINVIKNYSGPGLDRVVFEMNL